MMSEILTRLASRVSMMSGEVLAQAEPAAQQGGAAAAEAAATAGGGGGDAAAAAASAARNHDLLVPYSGDIWLPRAASLTTDGVDDVFLWLMGLSVFCFVGITVAVIYFTVKYRARPGHKAQPSAHHNDVIETIWTVIPALICVVLFVAGWRGYVDMTTPPKHALEVQVTARKWSWEFVHPNGVKDAILHVPAGQQVRLIMKSEDVVHSFFVPDFRVKKDVVPGRYTQTWFEAPEATVKPEDELPALPKDEEAKKQILAAHKGEASMMTGHRLFCSEYCGRDHSMMKTRVVVHGDGGYERYLAFKKEEQDNMPPLERGKDVYARLCFACHTVDGTQRVGPSFAGTFGAQRTFSDGSSAAADENYIRESILDPQAKLVQGYPASMPSFQGQLSEKEIDGVITYIKSLK